MTCRGIFVTDLDGTLLHRGHISEGDRLALHGLAAHRVLRVIATGRSLYSARSCLGPDFPVDHLILSTGNQIMDWPSFRVRFSASLGGAAANEVCRLLRDLNVSFMVHDAFPDNHHFAFHRGRNPVKDFERRLSLYAPWSRPLGEGPQPASQVVVIVDAGRESLHERLARELPWASVIRATSPLDGRSAWIEIFAAGVSKATGIRRIVEQHGLHGIPVAAVGNDHNDSDMLDLADLSYQVADSHLGPDAKYIAAPGVGGAVAYAIAHYTEALYSGMTRA